MSTPKHKHQNRTATAYAEAIKAQFGKFSKPWFAIAKLVTEANDELDKAEFESVIDAVRISYSVARKLIKVQMSDRLKRYSEKLQYVDSYTTLHAIAVLKSPMWELFEEEILSNEGPLVLTRAHVKAFKDKHSGKTPKKRAQPLITVSGNPNAAWTIDDHRLLQAIVSQIESLGDKVKLTKNVGDLEQIVPSRLEYQANAGVEEFAHAV